MLPKLPLSTGLVTQMVPYIYKYKYKAPITQSGIVCVCICVCVLVLRPTSDQSFASGPSLVFSVSERELLPAFAIKEGAGGAPDRLRTTKHHLLAALFADEDHAPRRTDHVYPLRFFVPWPETRSHTHAMGTR